MSAVLSFEFYQGLEVPPPSPIDQTLPRMELAGHRADWMERLNEAIRDHGPWGFIKVYSDCSVELFDVSITSVQRLVRTGHTAYLLLAREARTPTPTDS